MLASMNLYENLMRRMCVTTVLNIMPVLALMQGSRLRLYAHLVEERDRSKVMYGSLSVLAAVNALVIQ
jgi:hypothetical protein